MVASARTIVIAGGGFSGVAVAATLLRTESPVPLRNLRIERHRGQLARGAEQGLQLVRVAGARLAV